LWRLLSKTWGCSLFEFDDVERLSERMLRRSLPAEIIERAEEARLSGEVTFAEFYTFAAMDA